MNRLLSLLLFSLLLFGLSACKTTSGPVDRFEFPTNSPATLTLNAWFEGDAQPSLEDLELQSVEERFVAGEVAYWKGDVELAYELLVPILKVYPGHPLNRFVAARLYDLQADVVDFHRRAREDLQGVRYDGELPLTRVYLSMLGHVISLETWRDSDSDAPFDAGVLGFSSQWRVSPMMSPWRLLDFETPYEIEEQERIGEFYRSPQTALDDPANDRPSRPYHATGTTLTPGLSPGGIYYLETFLELDEARSFWLYGNFPAASIVWIGGEEILRREEKDYSPGKRMRRVELGPGTHRVLVKIANQPRYRDWFDLSFIDDEAGPLIDSPLEFSMHRKEGAKPGSVRPGKETFTPSRLEALLIEPEEAEKASSVALYLTALVSYQNNQPRYFDGAWEALM
ncbi:MAG: hypothetical protein ACNA8W_05440, partial [Bradymonadaceae bacterium]